MYMDGGLTAEADGEGARIAGYPQNHILIIYIVQFFVKTYVGAFGGYSNVSF